jgi:hypothetical protein
MEHCDLNATTARGARALNWLLYKRTEVATVTEALGIALTR